MKRIDALDSLRAFAVLGVLAHHAEIQGAESGWVGVDVFFALSGFLITSLLLGEVDAFGRISLRVFWIRRAARLYPALLLLVIGVLALSAVVGAAISPRDVMFSISYTMDLVRNDAYDGGSFGHTWSLAVEEQFYLLWPLVIVLVATKRRMILVTTGLMILSLTLALAFSSPIGLLGTRAYFYPDTRSWALLAGCLLALLIFGQDCSKRLGGFALCVVVMSVAPVVSVSSASGHWVWQSLLAVLATIGVIYAAVADAGWVKFLTWSPFVWLGRISYGIYLYHWPILINLGPHVPLARPAKLVFLLVVTVLVAWISSLCVERPILRAVHRRLADKRRDSGPVRIPQGSTTVLLRDGNFRELKASETLTSGGQSR